MLKKGLLLIISLFILLNTSVHAASLDEISKTREESYKNQEVVELFSGTWTVGEDIPAGRYEITAGEGESGNIFIGEGVKKINEILGTSEFGLGISKITVDLIDGDPIEIKGLNTVIFTPIKSELLTTLSTGKWVVGLDIEPGKYIVTTDEEESGNFFVDNDEGKSKVNEILGSNSFGLGVDKIQVKLDEGDLIRISSLENVYFE